jgi:hypothetical protein
MVLMTKHRHAEITSYLARHPVDRGDKEGAILLITPSINFTRLVLSSSSMIYSTKSPPLAVAAQKMVILLVRHDSSPARRLKRSYLAMGLKIYGLRPRFPLPAVEAFCTFSGKAAAESA